MANSVETSEGIIDPKDLDVCEMDNVLFNKGQRGELLSIEQLLVEIEAQAHNSDFRGFRAVLDELDEGLPAATDGEVLSRRMDW